MCLSAVNCVEMIKWQFCKFLNISHQAWLHLPLGHVLLEDGIVVPKHVGVMSLPSYVYNIVI